MFKIHLVIKKDPQADILCLSLSNWFRYFFFGFASFLTVFLIFDLQTHPGSGLMVPLIIIAFFFLFGCYHEEWVFNPSKKKIESHFGLLFLYQRKVIPLENIETFRMVEFTKGHHNTIDPEKKRFFHVTYSKFSLILKDGTVKDIEITKSQYKNDLGKKAEIIADFCKKPLHNKCEEPRLPG